MITHYDLFAGIGGFSLALEEVFNDATIRHIFCEWESFPTAVLRRHWPDGEFYGDIAGLVADTEKRGLERECRKESPRTPDARPCGFTIVTGGFPCQPFSHAGRRKGTADDRYQWPNMFAVIRNTKPEWVIAENVRGLVTWNDGLVLETVCADLESQGYEVQPFIIPAVAVGAPHRRDRVWIIGHNPNANSITSVGRTRPGDIHETDAKAPGADENSRQRGQGEGGFGQEHELDSDSSGAFADTGRQQRTQGSSGRLAAEAAERSESIEQHEQRSYPDWSRNWQEVALATCDDAVDDGLSRLVDGVPYSRAKWRKNSLKAYGNGIVPEVAMNIMQAIKEAQTV
jgi:DNA (cytosine-5)-methyltransferase 1